MRRLEACQSPVWDTALALIALADAGLAADHPAVERGARVAARARRSRAPRRLGGAPAAAGAGRLGVRVRERLLPRHRRHRRGGPRPAPRARCPALDDGGRTAASRGRSGCSRATAAGARSTPTTPSELVRKLPFCDFGEVIDPPTADVTAHVVEMLADEGLAGPSRPRSAAIDWLLREQEPDGSWFGRWGVNHVYGTGAAVPALVAAGVPPEHDGDPPRRRAGSSSIRTPTAAGARTCAPTTTRRGAAAASRPRRRPPGRCSRCSPPASARARPSAGSRWLGETQREDGTWDEP